MSDNPPPLNKADLAQLLEVSLPTLDKMIRRYGERFPVVARGSKGVEWQFDAAAVSAFVRAEKEANAAAGAAKDELLEQFKLPGIEPVAPGVSAADLLKLAQLRRLQREEEKEAGFLVVRADVRALLTDSFSRFNRDMASGIRQALRDHNTPEATIRSVEARIAEAQRRVVTALQSLLDEGSPNGNAAEPALL